MWQTADGLVEDLIQAGVNVVTTEVYQTEAQPLAEVKRIKVIHDLLCLFLCNLNVNEVWS